MLKKQVFHFLILSTMIVSKILQTNLSDDSMFKIMENLQKLIFKDDLCNKLLTINSVSGNKGFKGNFVLQDKKMLIWSISILDKEKKKLTNDEDKISNKESKNLNKDENEIEILNKEFKNLKINDNEIDLKNDDNEITSKNVEIEITFGENQNKEFLPYVFKDEYLVNFNDNEVTKQILMFFFKFNQSFIGEIDFKFENDLVFVSLDKIKYEYRIVNYLTNDKKKLAAFYISFDKVNNEKSLNVNEY